MDWTRLDKQDTSFVLEHIAHVSDPHLFSGGSSEVRYKTLSFYKDYMVYRITNYATLPSFSMDFLSNGESFHLLDGSNTPFQTVNQVGGLALHDGNVVDYVDFYLSNLTGEDGDIFLIRDPNALPFLDSLSLDQQIELKDRHQAPAVAMDENSGHFIVLADLFYDGTLLQAALDVSPQGAVDIHPREMIMNSTSHHTGYQEMQ